MTVITPSAKAVRATDGFDIDAIRADFPILAEKNRLDDSHWVRKASTFSCPDPKGLVQFRLEIEDET